ncbi:ABC transporter ATP-binding protein [Schaalia sp. ZJ405]|uniref:ABC transporter ATP-binding protein n=1 Tax=Schaalia sp. ZJ405 TaxID=2709403 RepID=UPI0013EC1414|nr:ABC transporter ATP-binding protein [Schaalia sp. ZJ405]QPK81706.1 ABC transporter ATP-binding protein [Schaalia sp. ZJ405]
MNKSLKQFRELLPFLPAGAVPYIWTFVAISVILTILDTVAVITLALSLSAIINAQDISIPLVGRFGPSQYIYVILVISLIILTKSTLSLIQQRLATRKFAEYEFQLGNHLFHAYLGAPWIARLSRTTSELVRMVDIGIAAINAGLIFPLLNVPSLLISSVGITLTLVFVQPITALVTVSYLGLIALVLYRRLSKYTTDAGRINVEYSFKTATLMTDMVGALKEITLRDKFDEVEAVVGKHRKRATDARADIQFYSGVPKFVLDAALIGGFLIIGLVNFVIYHSMDQVINAVVLFAVAGMRIIPSLTGFQATMNIINANTAQVDTVIKDIYEAQEYRAAKPVNQGTTPVSHPKELRLEHVTFTYPTQQRPALDDVSLTIPLGSSVAFVGESGSGKSTLVDLVLGLLEPDSGQIFLDDHPLPEVLKNWRHRIGYVPQEVALFDGTIEENIALSWQGVIDRDRIVLSLTQAQLWDTVQQRTGGLESSVGDRGMALSGGQRQRLGIARALYSNPLVLVLDEATSALDTETEAEIAQALHNLRGEITLISIAHRLSTIKDYDTLFYFESGRLVAQGTFDELTSQAEGFAHQAQLAGLLDPSDAE